MAALIQPPPVESPRSAYRHHLRSVGYDASELTHYVDMSTFRRQFQAASGKVDLVTFITLMQKALKAGKAQQTLNQTSKPADDKEDLQYTISSSSVVVPNHRPQTTTLGELDPESEEIVERLIALFKAIDLDGDGYIVLDEFTRFILDKAMHFSSTASTASEGIILPYTHQSNTYPFASYRHKNEIDRVIAINRRRGYLAVTESRCLDIFIYAAKTGRIFTTMPSHSPIRTMTYVEPHHHLVTSHADKTCVLWSLDDGKLRERWQEKRRWALPSTPISLAYVNSQDLLYSGTSTGHIYTWDIQTMVNKGCLQGHTDAVYSILSMDPLGMVASASKDTHVCVWDAYSSRQRLRLGGHKKAIFSLAFNPIYRLLVSAGYDHEAYVWSPLVGTQIARLQGHTCPLVSVCTVPDRPELMTADVSGVVKLWDIRTFKCVQNISKDHEWELHGLTDMTHIHLGQQASGNSNQRRSRLVTTTKILHFYDQTTAIRAEPLTDDMPISAAVYNDNMVTIITAAGSKVTVWDAFIGSKRATFFDSSKGDITTLSLDPTKMKIIIGDTLGIIQFLNHETGALMKSCPPRGFRGGGDSHESVVQVVHMGSKLHQIVAAFSDGAICIYDESRVHKCPLLIEFDPTQRNLPDLVSMVMSSCSTYIASAGSQIGDPIKLWNHTTAKCEIMLPPDESSASTYTVLSLTFLDPVPLLLASCSDGMFRVWPVSLRGGTQSGKRPCLLQWRNVPPEGFVLDEPKNKKEDAECILTPSYLRWPAARPSTSSMSSEGQLDAKEERRIPSVPRADSLEREGQLIRGAISIVWQSETAMLYTGDEYGCIRAWNLQEMLTRCYPSTGASRRRSSQGGCGALDVTRRSIIITDPTTAVAFSKELEDLVKLEWSVQAHEDTILSLQLSQDPQGLISAGSDLCCKMWTWEGSPIGTLIQVKGLSRGAKNSCWDLPIDVKRREKKERDEVNRVSQEAKARLAGHRRRSSARKSVVINSQEGATIKANWDPETTTNSSFTTTTTSTSLLPLTSTSRSHVSHDSTGSNLKLPLTSRSSTSISSGRHSRHSSQTLRWTSLIGPITISKHEMIMKVLQTLREDPTIKRGPGLELATRTWANEAPIVHTSADGDGRGGTRRHRRRNSSQVMMNKMKTLHNSVNMPNFDPATAGIQFWVTKNDAISGEVDNNNNNNNSDDRDDADGMGTWGEGKAQSPRPTTSNAKDVPILTTTYKKLGSTKALMLPPSPGRRNTVYTFSDSFDAKLHRLKTKLEVALSATTTTTGT